MYINICCLAEVDDIREIKWQNILRLILDVGVFCTKSNLHLRTPEEFI